MGRQLEKGEREERDRQRVMREREREREREGLTYVVCMEAMAQM